MPVRQRRKPSTGTVPRSSAVAPAGGLASFVGLLSLDGTLLEANPMAVEATALSVDDALGRPCWEGAWWTWSADGQHRLGEAIRRAADGEVIRYDEQVRVAGGRIVTIDFSIVPVVEAGTVRALVSSAVDVTQRLASERCAHALAELTHRLAEATSVHDVVTTVAESGRPILQATRCQVALWDRDRNVLVIPDEVLDHPDDRGGRARDAETVPAGDCTAAAPLRNALGRVFAVLNIDWPGDAVPSATRMVHLGAMIDICGRALQRAIAHDAQEALIRAMRHELLPAMPTVAGLELSARYLPASDQLAFGGDWYDAIPLGPTTTALVIGDVVGHGVHAAARMARVRGVLNALTQLDPDPGSVFSRAFDLLASLQDPFIGTAAVFVIDTANDVLTFASAGHPPALLRTPDGSVAVLAEGHGPALGLPARTIAPGRVPFGLGSTLLAYTDGLVERRDPDLDIGLRTIADLLDGALSASAPSAGQVLDRVLRGAGVQTHRRDDVAAVVVHRT